MQAPLHRLSPPTSDLAKISDESPSPAQAGTAPVHHNSSHSSPFSISDENPQPPKQDQNGQNQPEIHHNSSHSSHSSVCDESLSPDQASVAAGLAQGLTVSAAARKAGVHRTTIHHWFRNVPQFAAAFKKARQEYREALADEMRELSSGALKSLQNLLGAPETPPVVRLKAALAILERPRFPHQGWYLPERLESSQEQVVVDGLAEIEANFRAHSGAR